MLYENIGEWRCNLEEEGMKKGLQKGRQEGHQEGLQKGIRQGEAQLLASMLTQKFGDLPARHQEEIEAADSATILDWAGRALKAGSIDQVFDGNGQ